MLIQLFLKYLLNAVVHLSIFLLLFVDIHGIKLQHEEKLIKELHSPLRDGATHLANKKFQCPLPFGTFSDPEDCSIFHVCVFGISQSQKCPWSMHFDILRRRCLPILVAICDKGKENKPTTIAEEITSTVKENKFVCPSFYGNYPHPTDCSKYYTCSFFIPTLKSCKKNQLFDGSKKMCKPEKEVDCGSRGKSTKESTTITTPMPQQSSTETTTEEMIRQSTITEPSTTDQPITTKLSTMTEQPTSTEETTNTSPKPTGPPETDCDEDDLDCIIKETGEIPDWFECPEDSGAYPHSSHKKLFIYCQNWKPFVKKCGQDLIFSSKKGTCVLPTK